MPAGKVEERRDRNRALKVFVSESERAEIETRAAATGLSVSACLGDVQIAFGVGNRPIYDRNVVA